MRNNKTVATWLAFLGGPLGLHRFYLYGLGDAWGWMLPIPTALGFYGVQRVRDFGIDDRLSWALIPILGLTFAATALTAIVYGLTSQEKWNAKRGLSAQASQGATHWLTIFAVCFALLLGTTALMSSIVYGFQRYFEVQIEEARKISQ